MNTKKSKVAIFAAIAAIVVVGAVWFALPETKTAPKERTTAKQERKARADRRKPAERRPKGIVAKPGETKEKPVLELQADEEAKLTDEEKMLLAELQAGLDANSLRRVAKVVDIIQKIQREKGMDAVPVLLRSEAVEALGYFLPDSLTELIGFMADSDPDVLSDVMSQFESAIDDTSLGDRELSAIFKSVAKALEHEEALDALFMGIESDMRNSVAVETYLEILNTGSAAAKERIWESVEDFTGEDDIDSPEKLKKWLEENPDDEDDEEFYAGDKDDDADDKDDD